MKKQHTNLQLCLDTLCVQGSLILTTRNSLLNLLLLGSSFLLSFKYNTPWWFLLQPCVVLICNLSERFIGLSLWSREDSSKILYNSIQFMTRDPYGEGLDLGFNFYDGDYTKTASQAQLDKFHYAWNKLGLQPGMRVLDCGCGMGDWMHWLMTKKKCHVVGINMTLSHVKTVRSRGMKCIHSEWQQLYKNKEEFAKLAGQFDAVTFWDTVEHYCKASEITVVNGWVRDFLGKKDGRNEEIARAVYGSMFRMARELLDPNSNCGQVWISCLHQTHRWEDETPYGISQCYMMTSYYDGIYPYLDDGLSKFAALDFDLVHNEDRTEDYRMTSLLNRDHFGYLKHSLTPAGILTSFCSFFTDPQSLIMHLDFCRSALGLETAWMWHIGGIDKTKPRENSIAKLFWQVYRIKPQHKK